MSDVGNQPEIQETIIRPNPSRTVVRPFLPSYPDGSGPGDKTRREVIVERILALPDDELERELEDISAALTTRHRRVDDVLLHHFALAADALPALTEVDDRHRKLIGSYFTEEYAFEAAALFNPSVVRHPDQSGQDKGSLRVIMTLRGIGEGHVSSISFRTGTWIIGEDVRIDDVSDLTTSPILESDMPDGGTTHLALNCGGGQSISENVIFPILPSQKQGIEDVRMVEFREDDGTTNFYGTYTAFSGVDARSELLITSDFRNFEMRTLEGKLAQAKGMALFPRRVDGQFTMLGRHDNENIWLLRSDDLLRWETGEILVRPRFPWEFIQVGNCGSPVELDEGWLVLTHGVGKVRTYSIGACLLSKDDPSKLLARTPRPLLAPRPQDRDGYVPNVVYSCGGLLQDQTLLIPFGVADSYTGFATMNVDSLLAQME